MNDTIAQGQPFELTLQRPSPHPGLLVAAVAIALVTTYLSLMFSARARP